MITRLVLIFTIFGFTSAVEASNHHQESYARVTNVEPVYRTEVYRIPEETCWTETVRTDSRRHSGANTLAGGLIGGVIANEIARDSRHQNASVLIGAAIGLSIASEIEKHHSKNRKHRGYTRYEDRAHCEISHRTEREQVLKGYNVEYRYRGQYYTTFTREHPGKRIRVAVDVRPLGRSRH